MNKKRSQQILYTKNPYFPDGKREAAINQSIDHNRQSRKSSAADKMFRNSSSMNSERVFDANDSFETRVAKWERMGGRGPSEPGLLTESNGQSVYRQNNNNNNTSQVFNQYISSDGSPTEIPFGTVAVNEHAGASSSASGFMKDAASLLSIPEVVLKVQQDLKKNVITYEFLKPEAPRKSKGKRLRSQSPSPFRKVDDDPKITFAPVIQQLNCKLGRQQQPLVEDERPRKRRCFSFRRISTTVILGYLGTYLFNAFVNRMTGQALDSFNELVKPLVQMQMAGAFFGSFMGGDQPDNETNQLQNLEEAVDFGTFRFLNDSSAIKVDNAGLEQLFGDYTF